MRRRCEPVVSACRFDGIERAQPQADVLAWLQNPDLAAVIICPSNPFVSIAPVLGLPGLGALLQGVAAPVIAVSPIVGGQAIKGPAAKMMRELQMPASALEVARYYRRNYGNLLDGFVIDSCDRAQATAVEDLGIKCLVTDTVMRDVHDKERLARDLLAFVRDETSSRRV